MTISLERKKLRRTGYLPFFLGGAVLAGAFPVLNMLVRPETFTAQFGAPLYILMKANWQMMAMLNTLVLICASCMMYHVEFADNGIQKMEVLPVRQSSMFLGKFAVTAALLAFVILLETGVLTCCALHWFPEYALGLKEPAEYAGFAFIAALPTAMLMLAISSACRNMWVSLGIGVILVFTFSIFPEDNLLLCLLPFRSPFQIPGVPGKEEQDLLFPGIWAAETVLFGMVEIFYIKLRRCFA